MRIPKEAIEKAKLGGWKYPAERGSVHNKDGSDAYDKAYEHCAKRGTFYFTGAFRLK